MCGVLYLHKLREDLRPILDAVKSNVDRNIANAVFQHAALKAKLLQLFCGELRDDFARLEKDANSPLRMKTREALEDFSYDTFFGSCPKAFNSLLDAAMRLTDKKNSMKTREYYLPRKALIFGIILNSGNQMVNALQAVLTCLFKKHRLPKALCEELNFLGLGLSYTSSCNLFRQLSADHHGFVSALRDLLSCKMVLRYSILNSHILQL